MIFYILILICACTYLFLKYKHGHWARKGIAEIKPQFIYGSVKDTVLGKSTLHEFNKEIYFNLKKTGKKHGGFYLLYTPVWVPLDLDLIKQIMTTDFDYFSSHGFFHHEKDFISMHLFNVSGKKWRERRATLTPTFTSGKLKNMFDMLWALGERTEKRFGEIYKHGQPVAMKEHAARFGTDVVATCFFGIECDSLNEPNSEFRKHGKMIFDPRPTRFLLENAFNWNFLGSIGHTFSPKIITDFFVKVAKESIGVREQNNIIRKDYLDILIQLKKAGKMDSNEVIANMFLMYAAGFETSATTSSFLMYELAKDQEVQEKIRKEVLSVCKNGNPTYDSLAEMKYTEMCILETLRRYPPVPETPRSCTKTYKIPGTNEIIEKGTLVMVPAWGIHNDPKYYSNPEKFNPENFSIENKKARHEFAFLGFGGGPRYCIGSRFAFMQIKIFLITHLRYYKYTLNSETPKTCNYESVSITLTAKEPLLLDVEPIN